MNDKPEEKNKPIHEQGAARLIDLADPAHGDDANEFQGYRHEAGVSFIGMRTRTPSRAVSIPRCSVRRRCEGRKREEVEYDAPVRNSALWRRSS